MNSARLCRPAIALSLVLAGCGGHGDSLPAAPAQPPVTPYSGPATLANFAWGKNLMRSARLVGDAKFDSLTVHIVPRMQNAAGLVQYAQKVSDPHSPLYRHFLTPEQIGASYGATQADMTALDGYFTKYHVAVGTWPQHLVAVASGKQADLEAALGTKFGVYRAYGRTFIAPEVQPHFSRALPVSAIADAVHVKLSRRMLIRGSNGEFGGMSPQQLRRSYDLTGAANAGFTGTGINVGIIGTGPIWPKDVPAIGTLYKTQVAPVVLKTVHSQPANMQNGNTGTGQFDMDPTGLATPPPVTGDPSCTSGSPTTPTATCNPEDGEAQLDTEMAAELAPGATVNFYLAYNTKDCAVAGNPYGCPSGGTGVQGLYLTDDEIQQAIADNTVDTLSLSFGQPEQDANSSGYFDASGNGLGPAEFAALAAEGIAVFVSSGDNGAHDCIDPATGYAASGFCIDYPASDPSVVAVGGVDYPLDSAGNLPPTATIASWASNTTLGGDGNNDNSPGSGGGVSQFFAAPSWQRSLTTTPAVALVGANRTMPDVAMDADPLTGPFIVQYANYPGSSPFGGAAGGTSASAPMMAAAWGVVLQACKASSSCATGTGTHPYRLGNPSALFYSIYGNASKYNATFYDVVNSQTNGTQGGPTFYPGYPAGTGYDLVTGLGVPFIGHLINAVVPGQNIP